MKKNRVTIAVAAVAAVFVIGLFLGAQLLPEPAAVHAQTAVNSTPQRSITVVGEGIVNIKPDIAKTIIGVETVKETVAEASAENQEILTHVFEALKAAGIAEKDMQTAGFNIYAEQYYGAPDGGSEGAPQARYHVTNQVQVTIRDIDNVGDVLDAAIEAGANSTYGVEFKLDDQEPARAKARSLAVENAQDRALELAQLNDVTLGEVLSVSEVIGNSIYYSSAQAQVGMGGGGGTPISVGELQLTMQVQVTYAIE